MENSTTEGMDRAATAASYVRELSEFSDELVGAITYASPMEYVVGFPAHGLFLAIAETLPDGRVFRMRSAGILHVTRMSIEDAYAVTRNGNIRNGRGEVAEPMRYVDALRLVADQTADAIALLQRESIPTA